MNAGLPAQANKNPAEKLQGFDLPVRVKGLEPPRLSAPDPKSGAATNYAIPAFSCKYRDEFYGSAKV